MTISTYAELKSALSNWTHRSTTAALASDFIALAEARLNRDIRHPKQKTQYTVAALSAYVALPSDCLDLLFVEHAGRRLAQIDYSQLEDEDGNSGDAQYFCRIGDQIRLSPAQTSGNVEILYCAKIPALSDANTTNWLLTAYPDCYLFAALAEAWDYERDVRAFERANARAQVTIDRVNDDGAAIDAGAVPQIAPLEITSLLGAGRYNIIGG